MSNKQDKMARRRATATSQLMQAAKTIAGAHIEIPGVIEQLQNKITRQVEIRGKTYSLAAEKGTIAVPLLCALINLEDERIDKVLKAFKMKLHDANGNTVWPPEEPTDKPAD